MRILLLVGVLALAGVRSDEGLQYKHIAVGIGSTANFTNPAYPNYESYDIDVVWLIVGPPKGGLLMTCPRLSVSRTENCNNGFVEVYNGDSTNRICGDHRDMKVYSEENALKVHLKLKRTFGVVHCEIQGLDKPVKDIKEKRIHLRAEEEPYNGIDFRPFPIQEKYRWIFTVDPGHKVDVRCTKLWLDNYSKQNQGFCDQGSVSFDLGNNDVRTYCKSEPKISLVSSSNRMVVDVKVGSSVLGSLKCFAMLHTSRDFRNLPSEEVDSREHGMRAGIKQTTCNCGRANKRPTSRIIYGIDATENEFPWAVSLQLRNHDFHFCGGSILTPWHVISATHCVQSKKADEVEVLVGATHLKKSPGRKAIPVSRIVNHNYEGSNSQRDISILVMKEKIQFSNTVGPICLPKRDPQMTGQYITAVGWGRMAEDEVKTRDNYQLKKTHMRVVDKISCGIEWPDHYDRKHHSHICTWSNHTDICMGDSGGPVTWVDKETNRYFLVGLPARCDGCKLTRPSVHTNVQYFYDWIQKVISENEHADEKTCTKVE